jgi:hypothetical protein
MHRILDEFSSLFFYAETTDFWLGKLNFSLVVILILILKDSEAK